MTTNSKKIIDANKRHILNCYKGKGGATQFVKDIDHYKTFPDTYRQPYKAMDYVLQAPDLLWRTADVERYLHSIGLIDDRRIEKFGGAWELYTALMKRDGAKLYEDLKKKGLKGTLKSTKPKRKSMSRTNEFGLARL